MKLGIMQPYFFPNVGHYALIAHTEGWVVFDEPQYTPKTWISRNRILHPTNGWNWISIPLSNSTVHIKIHQAKILSISKAKLSTLGKLAHYKKKAPYYNAVINIINQCFDIADNEKYLVKLNINSLKIVCEYLDIPFKYKICSDLNINFQQHLAPGDWALEICKFLGANEYINPIGGRDLFNVEKYHANSVQIKFLDMEPIVYEPSNFIYIENLSILDVMMWLPPSEIKKHMFTKSILHF